MTPTGTPSAITTPAGPARRIACAPNLGGDGPPSGLSGRGPPARPRPPRPRANDSRSEEHTSELQSLAYLVCRLLLEKKNAQDNGGRSGGVRLAGQPLPAVPGGLCRVRDRPAAGTAPRGSQRGHRPAQDGQPLPGLPV